MRTALVAMVLVVMAADARAEEKPACDGRGTAVVVRTHEHALLLCEGGREARRFKVALGSGGLGKRQEGDAKTPLGSYPLAEPRKSKDYGRFIHIGYPTKAQRAQGFTGSDVGIHGPGRGFRWAGALNTATDWTLGCIAVASDDEIDAIARWIRTKKVALVHLD